MGAVAGAQKCSGLPVDDVSFRLAAVFVIGELGEMCWKSDGAVNTSPSVSRTTDGV